MLRRINFHSVCLAFGISVLLILAGNRYTDNANYQSADIRKNLKNIFKVPYSEHRDQRPVPTTSYDYDGLTNVEKILQKTRIKIKSELENYNFSYSGVTRLEDLLLDAGGQPLRNIIISTWRSGTTFMGELMLSMPGTFYHYEPLLNYEIIQIRGPPYAEDAVNNLKNFLKCDFHGMDDYFDYFKDHFHVFSHNTQIWDFCKYNKNLCFNRDFVSRFCRLFPFQSMKVVRLRLRLVEDLLVNNELKLKVILLIRDPRAVMQSRRHRDFCLPAMDCGQPKILCADMVSDYVAAARLQRSYPDRLMVLRYEELALNPNGTTQELFKFLGMKMMPSVTEFLEAHTHTEVAGVSSTFRVSQEVPFKWKTLFSFDEVSDIQLVCKEAMDLWGYRMAHNATHLVSKDFNPLEEYTIKE